MKAHRFLINPCRGESRDRSRGPSSLPVLSLSMERERETVQGDHPFPEAEQLWDLLLTAGSLSL